MWLLLEDMKAGPREESVRMVLPATLKIRNSCGTAAVPADEQKYGAD